MNSRLIEKGMLYPDQFTGVYYTAKELADATYIDHLMDNDSWMLLSLRNGHLAIVVSVDYADALEEVSA